MNLTFLYWVAGLFAVITMIGVAYILYNRFKELEEPVNETIIENYMPQYSGGHTDGVVSEMEIGEERVKIVFYPRDINYIKELNKDKRFRVRQYILFYDKRLVEQIYYQMNLKERGLEERLWI